MLDQKNVIPVIDTLMIVLHKTVSADQGRALHGGKVRAAIDSFRGVGLVPIGVLHLRPQTGLHFPTRSRTVRSGPVIVGGGKHARICSRPKSRMSY